MINLLLSSFIFIATFFVAFYMLYKNHCLDYYSIILFLFISFTWIVPIIIYDNKQEFSIDETSASWIVAGFIFFLIQIFVRYIYMWWGNYLKSRKKVFAFLLLSYSVFLFLAIFIHSNSMFYILIFWSSALSATYGLSVNYWAENIDIKKGYEANMIIYILPLMGIIIAKTILPTFSYENYSPKIFFTIISSISLLIGSLFYILREKVHKKHKETELEKQKIFKNYNWQIFIVYPILLGISSFISSIIHILVISLDLLHKSQIIHINSNDLPLIIIVISFISFITAILVGNFFIRKLGYMKLVLSGIITIVIGIFCMLIMLLIKSFSWEILFISLLFLSIGITILQMLTLGDIVHIQLKTRKYFLTTCLSILSLSSGFGFLFTNILLSNDLHLWKLFSIIIITISILLILYSLILWKHRELLVILREKFTKYEYHEMHSKNDKYNK